MNVLKNIGIRKPFKWWRKSSKKWLLLFALLDMLTLSNVCNTWKLVTENDLFYIMLMKELSFFFGFFHSLEAFQGVPWKHYNACSSWSNNLCVIRFDFIRLFQSICVISVPRSLNESMRINCRWRGERVLQKFLTSLKVYLSLLFLIQYCVDCWVIENSI